MGVFGVRSFAFLVLCSFTFVNGAKAGIVKATITGTVQDGNDQGVFGSSGSLIGKSFTLVFTFDEAKGQQSTRSSNGVPYYSEIVGGGTTTLTIAGKIVSFPQAGDARTRSSAWRNVRIGDNAWNEFYFDVPGVSVRLGPGSAPLLTTNYEWRAPLEYQFPAGSLNTQNSFNCGDTHYRASGYLKADSIVITAH